MSEDKKGLSRRDAIKFGIGAGVAVGGGLKLVDWLSKSQTDISNPEVFDEFLGKEQLFEGYKAFYKGKVYVREGASIHGVPTEHRVVEKSDLDTTMEEGDTHIERYVEEEFSIKNPLLFLSEAHPDDEGSFVVDVKGPTGEVKKANLMGSWIIFEETDDMPPSVKDSIKRSSYGVGCVRIGASADNLAFQKEEESDFDFTFDSEVVVFSPFESGD